MGMRAPVTVNGHNYKDTDWKDVKSRIVAALGPEGVMREYRALGVRFDNGFNSKGKAECHAVDRPDEVASAFVNVRTGLYHSKGATVETLNLFDFALKYGGARFGEWVSTVKHYAELTGIPLEVRKDSKGRIVEATYDYTDEAGNLLYQVIRYRLASGKKDFRQRRPDGKGGWIYDLEGTRRVLYRLSDILSNPKHTVVVVEGEKDADRLNEHFHEQGIIAVATTSAQGANDTGRWDSYSELLRSRNVVVIPDADASGQRHARAICGFLSGIAETVKMVELPGVGPKGDVSDWLDQDNSLEDLWALIVEATPFDPATAPPIRDPTEPSPIIWGSSITPRKVSWLWPARIPIGKQTTFAGQTGMGKTFAVCDIAARVTRGMEIPFTGGMCFQEGKVLIISAEDDADDTILPRFIELGGDPCKLAFLSPESEEHFSLAALELLSQSLDAMGDDVRVVAIDPPTSYLGRTDDHKNAELRGLLAPLKRWAAQRQVALIFVTHVNKPTGQKVDAMARVIGSVAWVSAVRAAHMFCPDPDTLGRSLFVPLKINNGPKGKSLSYQIDPTQDDGAVLKWVEEVDTTADEAMGNVKRKSRGMCAVEWLADRFREQVEWESEELKKGAAEAGISKNALWSPEVNALPIKKRKRANASGDPCWFWIAETGWPILADENGKDGTIGILNGKPF